jgi:hypothetical protein
MGGRAVVADRRLGGWEGASPRPSALPLGELEAADGFFFLEPTKIANYQSILSGKKGAYEHCVFFYC